MHIKAEQSFNEVGVLVSNSHMSKGRKSSGRNWIKSAIKHKGAFSAYATHMHLPMSKAIAKGSHSRNPTTRRRAILARTLRHMHHH